MGGGLTHLGPISMCQGNRSEGKLFAPKVSIILRDFFLCLSFPRFPSGLKCVLSIPLSYLAFFKTSVEILWLSI